MREYICAQGIHEYINGRLCTYMPCSYMCVCDRVYVYTCECVYFYVCAYVRMSMRARLEVIGYY